MNSAASGGADTKRQLVAAVGVLLILAACEPPAPPVENHPQWVIHSKVSFVEADLTTPREPLPVQDFNLRFPYVAGNLEGDPTIAPLVRPQVNPDYSFVLDLNRTQNDRTQNDLAHLLQPTEFNGGFLRIDPEDARIARLRPQALKPDNSVEPVASTAWVDTRSHTPLMLAYFDRPARITGAYIRNGRIRSYNIRAGQAGYVWISCSLQDGVLLFREVEQPEHLILALTPKSDYDACEGLSKVPPTQSQDSAVPLDLRGGESPRQAAARERVPPER
jgi:hypothetical protein